MSQENVELVKHCYDLFSKGDLEGMLAYLDDDIEINEGSLMPGAGSYHGHDGFLLAIEHWAGEFEDFRVEIERLIEAQDNVIALVRQWGRGRQSGVPVEIQVANVIGVKDGKLVQWSMYTVLADALEAVGLEE
jgi:uncharacterized protein